MKKILFVLLAGLSASAWAYQVNALRVERVPVYDGGEVPQKIGELLQGQTPLPLPIKRIDGDRGLLEVELDGKRGWVRKGMVTTDLPQNVDAKCVASASTNAVAGIRGAEKACGK